VAVIVAVFAAPATAAVASPPAVDQYTQHLPTAGGGSGAPGETPPVARLGLLPSKTQAALSGPDGQLLAQIATAKGLGAPALNAPTSTSKGGSKQSESVGGSRGFVAVVTDTAGTGASLALIGALAVIALPGAWNRLFGRRRSPDQLL
jgi:hypothetical protein